MISFSIALLILIAGYFTYGVFVSKVFGQDSARPTPVHTMADGVDYVKLSTWKIFLIQFLNIAGLGPIFGAIMGVMFGPAAFLWIVFGTIFAGTVHDHGNGDIHRVRARRILVAGACHDRQPDSLQRGRRSRHNGVGCVPAADRALSARP